MGKLTKRIADLLFPPRCAFCGRITEGEGACPSCRDKLPYFTGTTGHKEFFSRCTAAFRYEGVVRASLLRFKFGGRQSCAAAYAPFVAEAVRRELGPFDSVSWPPVSAKRKRQRGYDQAELLARATARCLGKEAAPLLVKTRDTPKQSGLADRAKRRANVMGAYRVRDAEAVRGRTVLLIDDIVTTGATLSECARELLMAGAADVVCAAVAAAKED